MTDRTSSVTLQWNTDRASLQQVKQAVTDIQSRLKSLNTEGTKGSATFKRYSEVLTVIGRNQAIEDMTKDFVRLSKATNDNVSTLRDLRSALREIGASEREINKATRAFKEIQEAAENAKTSTQDGFSLGRIESAGSQLQRGLRGIGLGSVAEPIDIASNALQSIMSVKSAFTELTAAGGALIPVLGAGAAAMLLLGPAIKGVTDAIQQGKAAIDAAVSGQKLFYEVIATGTTETIKKQIEELEGQKSSQELILKQLQDQRETIIKQSLERSSFDLVGFAADTAAIDALNEEINKLTGESGLTQVSLNALNAALGDFGVQMRDAADAAEKAAKAQEFYNNTVVAQQEAKRQETAERIKSEKEFREKQLTEIASIQDRYNKTIASIEQESANKEVEIKQKTADKIAEILQKEIDASNNALAKLRENEARITDDFTRNELKAEIDAREEERSNLVSHLRKVRDIQRSFASQERDALLDRNFLQLFQLQEQKKDEEKAEETAFQEKQEDTKRQRDIERRERLSNLQHSLNDARAAYVKELNQARQAKIDQLRLTQQAEQTELNMLQQSTRSRLSIEQQGYAESLRIASLGAAEQIALAARTQAALIAQAQATLRAIGIAPPPVPINPGVEGTPGGPIYGDGGRRMFAEGGHLSRGKTGIVQELEGLRETANGQPFPPGAWAIQALQPLNIKPTSSGRGNTTIYQDIKVMGNSNPTMTAREVIRLSRQEAWNVYKETVS